MSDWPNQGGLRNREQDAEALEASELEDLRSDEEEEDADWESEDRSGDRTDGGVDDMEEPDNRTMSRGRARGWELRPPWPADSFKQVKHGNAFASWFVHPKDVKKILVALAEQWTSGDTVSNRRVSRGLCPHAPRPRPRLSALLAAHTASLATQTRD